MNEILQFRGLKDDFLNDLRNKKNNLSFILDYESKNRKQFIVEIRDDFLDLYFLGHGIVVKKRDREAKYFLCGSNTFNPKPYLASERLKAIVKQYSKTQWKIYFDEIDNPNDFMEILNTTFSRIVDHRRGAISEGVSEINHFVDNRDIGKNGILIIDRQVVFPKKKGKIDLLGIKRLTNEKFTFSVLELKNKNNPDINRVFSQLRKYIDIVFEKYDSFAKTYTNIINQKIKLRLLKRIKFQIADKSEISKNDIKGVVILDNFNIRTDLRQDGLLHRALRDWKGQESEYSFELFLKTNVLDNTFFLDYPRAEELLNEYVIKNKG